MLFFTDSDRARTAARSTAEGDSRILHAKILQIHRVSRQTTGQLSSDLSSCEDGTDYRWTWPWWSCLFFWVEWVLTCDLRSAAHSGGRYKIYRSFFSTLFVYLRNKPAPPHDKQDLLQHAGSEFRPRRAPCVEDCGVLARWSVSGVKTKWPLWTLQLGLKKKPKINHLGLRPGRKRRWISALTQGTRYVCFPLSPRGWVPATTWEGPKPALDRQAGSKLTLMFGPQYAPFHSRADDTEGSTGPVLREQKIDG